MSNPPSTPLQPVVIALQSRSTASRAVQGLIAGAAAAAAEAGMVLKGQKLPVLGRAGIVGLVSALGAILGLIAGRMVDNSQNVSVVFQNFGQKYAIVGRDILLSDAASGLIIGALASMAVNSNAASKLKAESKAALVGLAVALSGEVGRQVLIQYGPADSKPQPKSP